MDYSDDFYNITSQTYRTVANSENNREILDWGLNRCFSQLNNFLASSSNAKIALVAVNTDITNDGLHWLLGVINFTNKTVIIIDSQKTNDYKTIFHHLFK